MEVPRLGIESELQLLAYIMATAIRDPICIYDLHHSSWQWRILNPLSEIRDWTCVLMDTSQAHYCWATMGTPLISLKTTFLLAALLFSKRSSAIFKSSLLSYHLNTTKYTHSKHAFHGFEQICTYIEPLLQSRYRISCPPTKAPWGHEILKFPRWFGGAAGFELCWGPSAQFWPLPGLGSQGACPG